MIHNSIEFNLLDAPLDGRSLIEASAGTGKTYALAGLFLRFILEKKLSIGEILAEVKGEGVRAELEALYHTGLGYCVHTARRTGTLGLPHTGWAKNL